MFQHWEARQEDFYVLEASLSVRLYFSSTPLLSTPPAKRKLRKSRCWKLPDRHKSREARSMSNHPFVHVLCMCVCAHTHKGEHFHGKLSYNTSLSPLPLPVVPSVPQDSYLWKDVILFGVKSPRCSQSGWDCTESSELYPVGLTSEKKELGT